VPPIETGEITATHGFRPSTIAHMSERVVLVTGVGRSVGIGAAIASVLANDGWTVATTGWRAYDEKMAWGADTEPRTTFEADLADPTEPARLFADVNRSVGPVRALIMCHCESVDSSISDTTVESFDRHFAVNARATWLLIKSFTEQFPDSAVEGNQPDEPLGRIVAITSDHTAHNLPYGASKGALDRIVLAAAVELADRGITANVINPGANDTGWMSPDTVEAVLARNLQPRVGRPADTAALVRFLCSPDGQWINSQLLYSDGGLHR
jgi:3-oxoacyl-[acyl-carrier protein] reductase